MKTIEDWSKGRVLAEDNEVDDETIAKFREVLSPGELIDLKPHLAFPGGRYLVVSITKKGIKLRLGKKDPILLSLAQFLSVWTPGGEPGFGEADGVLSAFRYRVGRGGLRVDARRRILECLFAVPYSKLPSVPEVREWGEARTRARLSKMANCLAAFARNAQRRARPPVDAINDWKADLSWLRQRFDEVVRGISWPSPDADGSVF